VVVGRVAVDDPVGLGDAVVDRAGGAGGGRVDLVAELDQDRQDRVGLGGLAVFDEALVAQLYDLGAGALLRLDLPRDQAGDGFPAQRGLGLGERIGQVVRA